MCNIKKQKEKSKKKKPSSSEDMDYVATFTSSAGSYILTNFL